MTLLYSKKAITIFTFNFLNYFCDIISHTWWWTCNESRTINKFYFLRNYYNTLVPILINFSNFFLYFNKRGFLLFCVFPKTFKFYLKLDCWFFYDQMTIIVWPVVKNYRNFPKHIKSYIKNTMCCVYIFANVMTNGLQLFNNFYLFQTFFMNLFPQMTTCAS